MRSGDDVMVAAELAVGGGRLQQPALEAGAVHGGHGAAARARPRQALARRAAEADAADAARLPAARAAALLARPQPRPRRHLIKSTPTIDSTMPTEIASICRADRKARNDDTFNSV